MPFMDDGRIVLLRIETEERQLEAVLPDRLAVATAVVASVIAENRQDVVRKVQRLIGGPRWHGCQQREGSQQPMEQTPGHDGVGGK